MQKCPMPKLAYWTTAVSCYKQDGRPFLAPLIGCGSLLARTMGLALKRRMAAALARMQLPLYVRKHKNEV